MRTNIFTVLALTLTLMLTGCGSSDDSASQDNSPGQSQSDHQDQTEPGQDLTQHQFDISWRDALDMAQDEFDGDVSKIELERRDASHYVYKIELLSDTQKFALQADAKSGEVLDTKTDDLDSDERDSKRQDHRIDLASVTKLEKAINAARQEHDGPINKWKLEGKSGGAVYEFDITDPDGDEDWEVQIDAHSGDVIDPD